MDRLMKVSPKLASLTMKLIRRKKYLVWKGLNIRQKKKSLRRRAGVWGFAMKKILMISFLSSQPVPLHLNRHRLNGKKAWSYEYTNNELETNIRCY